MVITAEQQRGRTFRFNQWSCVDGMRADRGGADVRIASGVSSEWRAGGPQHKAGGIHSAGRGDSAVRGGDVRSTGRAFAARGVGWMGARVASIVRRGGGAARGVQGVRIVETANGTLGMNSHWKARKTDADVCGLRCHSGSDGSLCNCGALNRSSSAMYKLWFVESA